jgi:hypothetical protein
MGRLFFTYPGRSEIKYNIKIYDTLLIPSIKNLTDIQDTQSYSFKRAVKYFNFVHKKTTFSSQEPGNCIMISFYAVPQSHILNDNVYEGFLGLISPERKLRTGRFFRREDACRSVTGEILARYGIGRKENCALHSISFNYNDHGKPYVDSPPDTHFSISHSGSWTMCAIDNQPIGVDVERIHRVDGGIAQRFFSAFEYSELSKLPI